MQIVPAQFDTERLMEATSIVEERFERLTSASLIEDMRKLMVYSANPFVLRFTSDGRPRLMLADDGTRISFTKDMAVQLMLSEHRMTADHIRAVAANLSQVEAEVLPMDDRLMPADLMWAAGGTVKL
jgi:hypothetical protein